jgi:uroporphyrin-III C-methyltransferase/precorrin-2 dehydrogenase/sirohydrochlorin ferrochelatase
MLLPLFLNVAGRRVLLVGGGPVAAAKLRQLLASAASVHVVSPAVVEDIERASASAAVTISRREFAASDLDDVWLAVAAATPEVNRNVAAAAESRRVFVNAVDDPANASAFLSGVIRREGVTLAISTSGEAPGLTALLRQGIDELLPRRDLANWVRAAREERRRWKAEGVPMDARRPLLLDALNNLYGKPKGLHYDSPDLYGRPKGLHHDSPDSPDVVQAFRPANADSPQPSALSPGHVSLVGAGPGDPALLTRKAIATLRAADLVLYDALVDDRVLRYARHAQRFFVGKREGRHVLSQEKINSLMIRAARRGRRVVRLKGGDPFVLGRGGEEAVALGAADIPFDVVPGISSAIAAPALAGIPVTHRGLASAFLVVSGHDAESFSSAIAGLDPRGVTVVVLMGIARRAALAARLLDRGWFPDTPAAVVVDASSPGQQLWRGTLRELAGGGPDLPASAPGTIVIGEVVSLAEALCQPSTIKPHTAARG